MTDSVKKVEIPELKIQVTEIMEAESAAEWLRTEWNLGGDPISNMTELFESKGIKVIFLDFDVSYSGCSLWVNDNIPVIVCNRIFSGDRQRFTLAHELAHMILDIGDDLAEEAVCHRFAGAFLAPRLAVFEKMGQKRTRVNLDELLILKQEYEISLQALARRFLDLEIISKTLYTNIMKEFSKRGWRREEPGEQIPPEKSYRFRLLLERTIAENLASPSELMDVLGISPLQDEQLSLEELQKRAIESGDLYSDQELTVFTRTNVEDIFNYDY